MSAQINNQVEINGKTVVCWEQHNHANDNGDKSRRSLYVNPTEAERKYINGMVQLWRLNRGVFGPYYSNSPRRENGQKLFWEVIK